MSYNEVTSSRTTETSIDGYWHLTRMFFVRGPDRASILGNLANIMKYDLPSDIPPGGTNEHLPVIGDRADAGGTTGDSFQIGEAVTVYAYNAVTIPTDVPIHTYVEIRYSNDPRLIAKKIEEQLTFQRATMALPIGQRSTRAAAGGSPVFPWTMNYVDFPYKVGRFSYMALLKDWEVTLGKRPILEQTGYIHWLPILPGSGNSRNLLMLFMGADIVRYSPSYFSVRYSWEYDGGHKGPLTLAVSDPLLSQEVALPQQNLSLPTFTTGNYVRPPYYQLRGIILPGAGTRFSPNFYGIRSDIINPDGYTDLVGLNL